MRRLLVVLALQLLVSRPAHPQNIGDVISTPLIGGQATLTADFTNRDHELILYSRAHDGVDTSRTYSFTISGGAATKPITLTIGGSTRAPSPHDELARLLRLEEQALTSSLGPDRAPAAKQGADPAIESTRSFTFRSLGNVTRDRTLTATLVAKNSAALAYLDVTRSDSARVVTNEEIQAIIDRFSESSVALVNDTFGGPSDVDGDGRLLFLFTPIVDEVGRFGGFYRAASLFDTSQGGDGNVADMMYLSPSRPEDFYDSLLAHEYQHLVNYNQHVIVNRGDSEESWLNEALSHFTEDLIGDHVEGGNASLVRDFMEAPETFRLTGDAFANPGIRGAAYLSLQTMIDLHGSSVPSDLVNTDRTGADNVEQVTGAPIEELFETYFARNFLSGTGINANADFTYQSVLMTDAATGGRVIPHPMDRQIALPATAVSGTLRPAAAAYFRLTAEGGRRTVTIDADPDADLVALVVPLDRGFQTHNVLPTNFLPQFTLDEPLVGDVTTGQPLSVAGEFDDPTNTKVIFRFDPIEGDLDTLTFESLVSSGRFSTTLLFPHDAAGIYELSMFAGVQGELLTFIGRVSRFVVEQGAGTIDLPVDFFEGFTTDAATPTTVASGETLRLSGSISDPTVSEILFMFVDPSTQAETKFSTYVTGGQFEQIIIFTLDQVGEFELKVFAGPSGQSLPIVGRFSTFTVTEGDADFTLPLDFFNSLRLSVAFPTTIRTGEAFTFSGTTTDPSIDEFILRLTGEDGSEIRFEFNAFKEAFRQGLIFLHNQTGVYTLDVFAGASGGTLPSRGTFSPVTIVSSGNESVSLPVDIFGGLLLDTTLPTDFFLGQGRQISGVLTDASATSVAFRFDASDGTPGPGVIYEATNGAFSLDAPFSTLSPGTYNIAVFSAPPGGTLSFLSQFGPVTVHASQPRLTIDRTTLSWEGIVANSDETLTLLVGNGGSETLTLTDVSVDNAAFSAVATDTNVPPGSTVTIDITFAPSDQGEFRSTLTIRSNDLDRPALTVSLTADALAPPMPVLALDRMTVDYDVVTVGQNETQNLVVSNGGAADLFVDSIRVEGPFTANWVAGTIPPGEALALAITFTPAGDGEVLGTLTLFTPDATTIVQLSGSGETAEGEPPAGLLGDFNGDNTVGFPDFILFASAFGAAAGSPAYFPEADLNDDGVVDFSDFILFAAQFGASI